MCDFQAVKPLRTDEFEVKEGKVGLQERGVGDYKRGMLIYYSCERLTGWCILFIYFI